MTNLLDVDIGGVIIDKVNDNTDTSFFGDNYLKTTAVPDVFESIAHLNQGYFKDRVYLVSKCGKNVQRKTLEWLAHHDFYDRTGVLPDKVNFCRKRNEKAGICQELGITHFVDDRLEILGYLVDDVEKLYLFKPTEKEVEKFKDLLPKVKRVEAWKDLTELLAPNAFDN